MESISNKTLIRADRKDLAAETKKSAITDHVAKDVIDWSGATILDRESQRRTRQLKVPHTQEGQLHEQRRGSLQPTDDL